MNIVSNLKYVILCFALSTGSLFSAASNLTDYYSDANLTQLNAQGVRKHAPLIIIIDQENLENPENEHNIPLTINFARMLQEAFVPILVSHSIAYNYLYRRKSFYKRKHERFNERLKKSVPNYNTIPLDNWSLYEVPDSQFLLFVPDHYLKYYHKDLGLRLPNLNDISDTLKSGNIVSYLKDHKSSLPFAVDNLRSVLDTIKVSPSEQQKLTKSELKQQSQLPIWDIVLHGHGEYQGDIGDLCPDDLLSLLNFFNNELPVGTFFIDTCQAGGENLTLLEFEHLINNDKILRNFDYIIIVGSITDAPTYIPLKDKKKFVNFYNNAAQLQGRGASLDRLLKGLRSLYRNPSSPHGAEDIPQIWLPRGLGFQTYQVDQRVQILNNVKVRKHEDEGSPIILPDSSVAVLIYVNSIDVPVVVTARTISTIVDHPHWKNIPTAAQKFISKEIDDPAYPALTALSHAINVKKNGIGIMDDSKIKAQRLLYPQFISMVRGHQTINHFKKIEVESPKDKNVAAFTGVLHFLRDAFFDVGDRDTSKVFLIDELVGNNDISLLLESIRLQNKGFFDEFELELRPYIGKPITLRNLNIETDRDRAYVAFMFNNRSWLIDFDFPENTSEANPLTSWQFEELEYYELKESFESYRNVPKDSSDQKSISEVIRSKLTKKRKRKR